MKYIVPLMILTRCLLIECGLEWKVLKKITDYGQNVTLACNVSNCCPKLAGWDKYTPTQRTIFIDVKTWKPNKKYDGKVLTDGYTLVIQNLTKQDLNVSYACVYGSSLGEQQYLLEENVFEYISTTQQNGPIDNGTVPAGNFTGIIIGVSVAVLVVLFVISFWNRRMEIYRNIRNSFQGSNEEVPLLKWPPSCEDQENMVKDSVIRITDLQNPLFLQMYTDPNVYKMRNKTRGKVFLVHNNEFRNSRLSNREASSIDNSNLRMLFKELHFDVIQKDNLTAQEILTVLKEERDKVDWNTMDCVILLISSHGLNGGIFGTDGLFVELEHLTEIFDSSNCPGLDKKPRLVFVEACRVSSEGPLSVETNQEKGSREQLYLGINDIGHTAADFLIAYATPAGNASFRHIHIGSWFLNAIVWIFKYNAHEEEIQHMFLKVNQLVSQGRTLGGRCTVSEIKNNLRKRFYFFPGVHDYPPKFIDS